MADKRADLYPIVPLQCDCRMSNKSLQVCYVQNLLGPTRGRAYEATCQAYYPTTQKYGIILYQQLKDPILKQLFTEK